MMESMNSSKSKESAEKKSVSKRLNVMADVALIVRIPTGDPGGEVQEAMIEDIVEDQDYMDGIADAINGSEKIDEIIRLFLYLGKIISDRFPQAEILASRELHLQEPQRVDLDGSA